MFLLRLTIVAAVLGVALAADDTSTLPARQMEQLGRGVVAIHQGEGKVFVSWRLLGTDPDAIADHGRTAAATLTR